MLCTTSARSRENALDPAISAAICSSSSDGRGGAFHRGAVGIQLAGAIEVVLEPCAQLRRGLRRLGVRGVHLLRLLQQRGGVLPQLRERLELVGVAHQEHRRFVYQQLRVADARLVHRRTACVVGHVRVVGIHHRERRALEDDRQRHRRGRRSAERRTQLAADVGADEAFHRARVHGAGQQRVHGHRQHQRADVGVFEADVLLGLEAVALHPEQRDAGELNRQPLDQLGQEIAGVPGLGHLVHGAHRRVEQRDHAFELPAQRLGLLLVWTDIAGARQRLPQFRFRLEGVVETDLQLTRLLVVFGLLRLERDRAGAAESELGHGGVVFRHRGLRLGQRRLDRGDPRRRGIELACGDLAHRGQLALDRPRSRGRCLELAGKPVAVGQGLV